MIQYIFWNLLGHTDQHSCDIYSCLQNDSVLVHFQISACTWNGGEGGGGYCEKEMEHALKMQLMLSVMCVSAQMVVSYTNGHACMCAILPCAYIWLCNCLYHDKLDIFLRSLQTVLRFGVFSVKACSESWLCGWRFLHVTGAPVWSVQVEEPPLLRLPNPFLHLFGAQRSGWSQLSGHNVEGKSSSATTL